MQTVFPAIVRGLIFFSGYTALSLIFAPAPVPRILISSLIATVVFVGVFEMILRLVWRRGF